MIEWKQQAKQQQQKVCCTKIAIRSKTLHGREEKARPKRVREKEAFAVA